MPEIPDALIPQGEPEQESGEIIRWRTIRYRSVALVSGAVVVATVTILLVIFPVWRASLFNWIRGEGGTEAAGGDAAIRQARFTNLDGWVRVRKANQVEWVAADL